jgi:hypothetical protein
LIEHGKLLYPLTGVPTPADGSGSPRHLSGGGGAQVPRILIDDRERERKMNFLVSVQPAALRFPGTALYGSHT